MKISKSLLINSDPDEVWQVIAREYDQVGNWASGVYFSKTRTGKVLPNAPCHGRVCETSLGPFVETIVKFDDPGKEISYVATGEKMPGFVKQLKATWKLKQAQNQHCHVSMSFDADIAFPFSILMGWMMRMQFNKAISQTMEELQYFLEQGKNHPRKHEVNNSPKVKQLLAGMSH